MREVCFIFSLVLAAMSGRAVAGPAVLMARPRVNIRADATVQSPRITVLQDGDRAEVLGSRHKWLRIRMPDGREGWVHSDLVKAVLVVSGRGVRIRAAGAQTAPVVAMAHGDDELLQLGRTGGWTQVQLPTGVVGWVWNGLVKAKQIDLRHGQEAAAKAEEKPAAGDTVKGTGATVEPAGEDGVGPPPRANPFVLGLQHELEGDHTKALKQFLLVPPDDASYLKAQLHVAAAYRRLGELQQARRVLGRCLELGAKPRKVYADMAEVYRLGGQRDSAMRYRALARGETWNPPASNASGSGPSRFSAASRWPVDQTLLLRIGGGAAGAVLLILTGVGIFLAVRRARRRWSPGEFADALRDSREHRELGGGEFDELERQIRNKQKELGASISAFRNRGAEESAGETGDEAANLDQLVNQLDVLRRGLELQDERARTYAELIRLQNMQIQALSEELMLRRRRGG